MVTIQFKSKLSEAPPAIPTIACQMSLAETTGCGDPRPRPERSPPFWLSRIAKARSSHAEGCVHPDQVALVSAQGWLQESAKDLTIHQLNARQHQHHKSFALKVDSLDTLRTKSWQIWHELQKNKLPRSHQSFEIEAPLFIFSPGSPWKSTA